MVIPRVISRIYCVRIFTVPIQQAWVRTKARTTLQSSTKCVCLFSQRAQKRNITAMVVNIGNIVQTIIIEVEIEE